MSDFNLIIVTAPDEEVAASIAKTIVEERLAGCVNIVKGIRSIYSWEGKTEDEPEVMMFIKTRKSLYKPLERRLIDLHPYSVPEVICLELKDGSEDYFKWLRDVTVDI
ncbi:MAG: divalent-cation tolerance protein CutA [Nitrospirae bacterium]|nr:MAG: divalent-cation tolerance protein CutA [Nitrospirota bacterium]